MAKLYYAIDISEAWLLCMEHLIGVGGTESNLFVEINSDLESVPVRKKLDAFYKLYGEDRIGSIDDVADTIFPSDFYRQAPGEEARQHLYTMQGYATRVEHRFIGDSYFDRLISWPHRLDELPKPWNQLEYRVDALKKEWDRGNRTINITELGISTGLPDDDDMDAITGDMRTQHPFKDRRTRGFPCLSHISLTIHKGRLDLTAVYRNQHFIAKAYGNFVGLSRLLGFLCSEIGCDKGSVICVATHADAELGKNGIAKKEILALTKDCRALYDSAGTEEQGAKYGIEAGTNR